MRRTSIVFSAIILILGCAGVRSQPEPEGNFIKVARIGMAIGSVNGKLTVRILTENYPAKLAGLKLGDIILSVDGKIITAEKEMLSLMNNKQPGDHVTLIINRDGKQFRFDIESKTVKARPTLLKLRNIISEDNKVTVAVIISEVKNSFPNATQAWAASMRNNLQSQHEMTLLSAFGNNDKFSVVDRSRLKHILDEYQFNQTGFVSDKLRAKIGEMTGSTHLLDVSFSRFRGRSYNQDDVLNARLIEIESGKVLAVDQIITH